MANALPPSTVSSSANDWIRLTRRAPSTTLAPCAERFRAVASPSPLLAPVMTTTFPSMLLFIILIPFPSMSLLVTLTLACQDVRSATGPSLQLFGVPSPLHLHL